METMQLQNTQDKENTGTNVNADNPEALRDQESILESLKAEIDSIAAQVATSDDLKGIRKNLVDMKEKVLALFLIPKNVKDEYINRLLEIFESIKNKQEEAKKEQKEMLDANFEKIKPELDSVLVAAQASHEFNNARKMLIGLQSTVKEAEIAREAKDEYFKKIQEVFDEINKKQDAERESFEMESWDNFLKAKPVVEAAVKFAKEATFFKTAREKLIEVQGTLKDMKLKKEQRDELYGNIRTAFDDLNVRQDAERGEFESAVTENWAMIKPKVDEAIAFASSTEDIQAAKDALIKIQAELKDIKLKKQQKDELYSAIREVFGRLNESLNADREEYLEECNKNFADLEIKVREAILNIEYSDFLKDIREGLLAVQDEIRMLKLTKDQRNTLFSRLREGFKKFDAKRDAYYGAKNKEKNEKTEKQMASINSQLESINAELEKEGADKEALAAKKAELESKLAELKSSLEEK